VCCLSGARAPAEVPRLVRMRGADGRDYLVSEPCLDKYSRQLYVYGIAAMARMMNSRVLVSGLSGLGAEIGKNIVLAGVKGVVVHDGRAVVHADLASNFLLGARDVGRDRAACCVAPLRELNKLTPVTLLEGGPLECTRDSLGQFTVVVLVDYARADIDRIGAYCHTNDITLLATGTYGLYGYCFADFGRDHKVSDADGEPPSAGLVIGVERSEQGATTTILRTDNKEMHGLNDGDTVIFTGVGGEAKATKEGGSDSSSNNLGAWCEALEGKCMTVKRVVDKVPTGKGDGSTRNVTNKHAFSVHLDSASLPPYSGGAFYFTQRKNIETVKHRSFSDALVCPEETATAVYDYTDWERPRKLHALLRALWDFGEAHEARRAPSPGDAGEAAEVVEAALSLLVKEGILSDPAAADAGAAQKRKDTRALLMTIALGAAGQLNPMAAIFGGLVGQEVMKACSGKYVPISQFFHFEDVHALPRLWSEEEGPPLALDDVACGGATPPTRYDGLVATMGREFLGKMQDARVFLVGSGALGCELLKNFAVCGLGTSEAMHGAGVTVTDMDTIENSNLCRQFLFREWDVGKEKSAAAAKAANSMNSAFKPTALNIKVAPDTEGKYNDAFWEQQVSFVGTLSFSACLRYPFFASKNV
jgi:ubiquitin-activating enzyme E1